ncbi:MAG: tetratricopeptide repeat protein [Bryobacteraceae bacterium]|nr:tetratricopeptide repeat protein [Bryobacteraceae bacterium]
MTRLCTLVFSLGLSYCIHGQTNPPEPPEEDASVADKEYVFNPLQASKEVRIGNFYFRKGSYQAARRRFEEATRWNPSLADAWLRLGDTQLKLKDERGARESYMKYVELDPESKDAASVRKRLAGKL